MLWIDGQQVVYNNYYQPMSTRSGTIALGAGYHAIQVAFMQATGGYGLAVQYQGADTGGTFVDLNVTNAQLTPDLVVGSLSGPGNVRLASGSLIVGTDQSNTNFGGVIAADAGVPAGLLKVGDGTLTLSGANTFSGPATLAKGHLHFASAAQPAVQGAVVLANAGSFLFMDQPNQFGPNSTLAFSAYDGHAEFAMYGRDQTIAGLSSVNGFAVVENSHSSFGPASASSTVTINQTSNTTYSGIIRDNTTGNDAFTLALVKSGNGKLTLSGSCSHSGATTVNAGTLEYASTAATGSTGQITVNNGSAIHFSPGASGATVSAPIELNGSGDGSGAMWTYVEGSHLTFTGPVTLLGNSQIQGYAAGSTLYFNGAIGGTGSLTFLASGAATDHRDFMVLSAASTFSGDLYIDNFAARAQVTLSGGANRLPATAVVHLGAGAWNPAVSSALELNGNDQILAGLSDNGVSSLAGARSVVNTSATAASLTLNTPSDQSFSGTIGGADIFDAAGDNLALVKSGSGNQTLSGVNSYTGGTTVIGGTLQIATDAQLGTAPATPTLNVTLDGGQLFNNSSAPSLSAMRSVYLGAGGGFVRAGWNQPFAFNGQLTGPGGLGVVWDGGAVTLANAGNDYSGATTIGTNGNGAYPPGEALLALAADNAIPSGPGKGNVLFGAGNRATLDLNGHSAQINGLTGGGNAVISNRSGGGTYTLSVGNNDQTSAFGGSIQNSSGSLALTKIGSGTLTLSGANTYSGNTTVNGGTLALGQINSNNEASTVAIAAAAGARLDLAFSGSDTVGQLSINGVQQPAGDYTSAHPSGAFTGSGTLHVTSGPAGFAGWITGTFANGTVPLGKRGPNDDSDHDGISNLMEYALAGLDPTVPNGAIGTLTGNTLSYTKRQPLAADLSYVIETSPDLRQPWTPQVTQAPGNTDATISYALPTGQGKLFARLRVEQQR